MQGGGVDMGLGVPKNARSKNHTFGRSPRERGVQCNARFSCLFFPSRAVGIAEESTGGRRGATTALVCREGGTDQRTGRGGEQVDFAPLKVRGSWGDVLCVLFVLWGGRVGCGSGVRWRAVCGLVRVFMLLGNQPLLYHWAAPQPPPARLFLFKKVENGERGEHQTGERWAVCRLLQYVVVV